MNILWGGQRSFRCKFARNAVLLATFITAELKQRCCNKEWRWFRIPGNHESCLAISQRLGRVATHFACKVADFHKSRMPHARGSGADTITHTDTYTGAGVEWQDSRLKCRCRYRYFSILSWGIGSMQTRWHTIISCADAFDWQVQFALFACTFAGFRDQTATKGRQHSSAMQIHLTQESCQPEFLKNCK